MSAPLTMLLLMVMAYNGTNLLDPFVGERTIIVIAFVGIGGISFAWLWFAFRCPECRDNIGKYVLMTADAGKWLRVLILINSCPYCKKKLMRKTVSDDR